MQQTRYQCYRRQAIPIDKHNDNLSTQKTQCNVKRTAYTFTAFTVASLGVGGGPPRVTNSIGVTPD